MSEEEDEIIIEPEEDASEDDDDCDFDIGSTDDEPEEQKETEEERNRRIEKEALDDLKRKYNVRNGAELRIISDLRAFQKSNPKDLGFTCQPYNGSISTWEVRLFEFDKKDPIYADMQRYKQETGKGYIELRVSFPPDYPMVPPFIRLVEPRCKSRTGRITFGGSICTNILTLDEEGWKPMYDFESLFSNIITEMLACEPKLRIDWNNRTPYSKEEAIASYRRVASDHGWKVSNWTPR